MTFPHITTYRIVGFCILFLVVILSARAALTLRNHSVSPSTTAAPEPSQPAHPDDAHDQAVTNLLERTPRWRTYRNDQVGLGFRYPPEYELTQLSRDCVPTAPPELRAATTLCKLEVAEPRLAGQPDPGDITIEVWSNPWHERTIEGWLDQAFPGIAEEESAGSIAGVPVLQSVNNDTPPAQFIETLLLKNDKAIWLRLRLPNGQRDTPLEERFNLIVMSVALSN